MRLILGMPFVLALVCTSIVAAEEPGLAEQLRGKWVLYRDTPQGRYKTVKEHEADRTVVTTYDPAGKPIHSHRSEFRIDERGSAPVFRYRNKIILIGPNAGAKDDRESAYLFRLDGNRLFEVDGMLPGDKGEPSLKIWERMKDAPVEPEAK